VNKNYGTNQQRQRIGECCAVTGEKKTAGRGTPGITGNGLEEGTPGEDPDPKCDEVGQDLGERGEHSDRGVVRSPARSNRGLAKGRKKDTRDGEQAATGGGKTFL